MKVTIDQEGCIECGACADNCAKVFAIYEGEKARITDEYQQKGPAEGSIPDDLSDCAQEAADSCPVDVIQTE